MLGAGGRLVLGDVVIPVTYGHDRPSTLAEQLRWLADAGLEASTPWSERDLVVVRADRPG